MKEIEAEFDLLKEYMDIYIQLLPYCNQFGGKRINKQELPTFDYFKKTYNNEDYSLVIPHYKESKTIYDKNRISEVYTRGMGSTNGIAYRFYNDWMGCKYYTSDIHGNYTIETEALKKILV